MTKLPISFYKCHTNCKNASYRITRTSFALSGKFIGFDEHYVFPEFGYWQSVRKAIAFIFKSLKSWLS